MGESRNDIFMLVGEVKEQTRQIVEDNQRQYEVLETQNNILTEISKTQALQKKDITDIKIQLDKFSSVTGMLDRMGITPTKEKYVKEAIEYAYIRKEKSECIEDIVRRTVLTSFLVGCLALFSPYLKKVWAFFLGITGNGG
jgi:hypothetical protein